MQSWPKTLDEWIEFYSPENMRSVRPTMAPVPVHEFLRELREARKRIACLDAPDVQAEVE